VGTWLPEPVLTGEEPVMERSVALSESLSMAFLVVLEALSPVERAVFLLREVFDYEYAEIAAIVEKSEENCRQIFARARKHLDAGRPRFEAPSAKRDELARRFLAACENGRLEDLVDLLAADATFVGDGGGKATATVRPVLGRERVARLMHSLFGRRRYVGVHARAATVNGAPGILFLDGDDRLVSVMAVEVHDGRVQAIRSVVNPEKLGHLGYALSDLTKLPRRG
jgi:RNA polymerase sigma-70 factor (ECF subfamily)